MYVRITEIFMVLWETKTTVGLHERPLNVESLLNGPLNIIYHGTTRSLKFIETLN